MPGRGRVEDLPAVWLKTGRNVADPLNGMKRLLVVSSCVSVLGAVLILFLAPQSAFAMGLALRMAGFTNGLLNLKSLVATRDAKCSMLDALVEGTSSERVVMTERLGREAQVIRRDGAMELIASPWGELWIMQRDHAAVIEEFVEQMHDGYRLEGRIRQGDVVVDCGANVGVVTRRALQLGASKVVAVDPGPQPLACLRRTFAAEIAEGRVVIYPKGVWDRDDELTLSTGDEMASTANSVALDRGSKGVKVQLTTIDKMVTELGLSKVDFIKMDIEGAEPNALRGAAGTLARFRPRLSISLEHRKTDPSTIPGLIRQLRSDYQLACGPCENMDGHIQPTVVLAN